MQHVGRALTRHVAFRQTRAARDIARRIVRRHTRIFLFFLKRRQHKGF
jgi:hypothetical protein